MHYRVFCTGGSPFHRKRTMFANLGVKMRPSTLSPRRLMTLGGQKRFLCLILLYHCLRRCAAELRDRSAHYWTSNTLGASISLFDNEPGATWSWLFVKKSRVLTTHLGLPCMSRRQDYFFVSDSSPFQSERFGIGYRYKVALGYSSSY